MRLGSIMLNGVALALAGCGEPDAGTAAAANNGALEGDATLIAVAQKISDAIGGCVKPADAQIESKVVGFEKGAIVMLGCSQGAYQMTHRLFAVRGVDQLELLSLPDFDTDGWFASDQASMAEIDAGDETLTTFRKSAGHGGCGSEGTYRWDGIRFALQELRWQDCTPDAKGPPFPVIWPTQIRTESDPNGATPAP